MLNGKLDHNVNHSFVCEHCSIKSLPFNQDKNIVDVDKPQSSEKG